jgi:hypothetical protein
MLQDIVDVRPIGGFNLRLTFEDGVDGTIDVSRLVSFHGVFEALEDPCEFAKVRINRELGSIEWPNGADLDPDVLYQHVVEQAALRGGAKLPS